MKGNIVNAAIQNGVRSYEVLYLDGDIMKQFEHELFDKAPAGALIWEKGLFFLTNIFLILLAAVTEVDKKQMSEALNETQVKKEGFSKSNEKLEKRRSR